MIEIERGDEENDRMEYVYQSTCMEVFHVMLLPCIHSLPACPSCLERTFGFTLYSLVQYPAVTPLDDHIHYFTHSVSQQHIHLHSLLSRSDHLCPCPGHGFPLPPPTGLLFTPDPARARCCEGSGAGYVDCLSSHCGSAVVAIGCCGAVMYEYS